MCSVVRVPGEYIGQEKAAGGFANARDKVNPQPLKLRSSCMRPA